MQPLQHQPHNLIQIIKHDTRRRKSFKLLPLTSMSTQLSLNSQRSGILGMICSAKRGHRQLFNGSGRSPNGLQIVLFQIILNNRDFSLEITYSSFRFRHSASEGRRPAERNTYYPRRIKRPSHEIAVFLLNMK